MRLLKKAEQQIVSGAFTSLSSNHTAVTSGYYKFVGGKWEYIYNNPALANTLGKIRVNYTIPNLGGYEYNMYQFVPGGGGDTRNAGPCPSKYTPGSPDWAQIAQHEGVKNDAYEIQGAVTIGMGINLTAQSAQGLLNMGVPQNLVDVLAPLLGTSGLAYYSSHYSQSNPFSLNNTELGTLDGAFENYFYNKVANAWNNSSVVQNDHVTFNLLPWGIKTALLDAAWNDGPGGLFDSKDWTDALSQNWIAVANDFQSTASKLSGSQRTRRIQDAEDIINNILAHLAPPSC